MFRNVWRRAFAVPVMALALLAGSAIPAHADEAENQCDDGAVPVQMVWGGSEEAVRDIPLNLFGEDNVIVPDDRSDDVVLCIFNSDQNMDPVPMTVELINVSLLEEDADDVYEHLTIRDTPAAEIRAAYADGGSYVVYQDDEFDGFTQVSFDWRFDAVYRDGGSPGNVAQVGVPREVTFVVRVTIGGPDAPTDAPPPPPTDAPPPPPPPPSNGYPPPPPVDPCPWAPELGADDPNCIQCPWQPGLIDGHPDCVKPPHVCPWDPDLVVGDPDCVEPPHPCPWRPWLPIDDPHCVKPVWPPTPKPTCPPHQTCPPGVTPRPPHGHQPPTHQPPGGGGIIAETGGFLVQQPLWIYGLAALGIAAVIGFARKRKVEAA